MIRALVVTLLLSLCGTAIAQPYPDRPVRIVVPYPPGGVDVLFRALSLQLSAKWGQPVVVENRPGAGAIIGTNEVARAAPNGYTLLATIDSPLVGNRFLYKTLPYDPDASFAPVSLVVEADLMVLVHPDVPVRNLRELVDHVKKQPPRSVRFGSFGRGSPADLIFGTLNAREKIGIEGIPYRGVSASIVAAMAGEVQLATGGVTSAGAFVRDGRLRLVSMLGEKRSPHFPDVQTSTEQGFPYLRAGVWYGLFAPAGTPKPIVDRISRDVTEILNTAEFRDKHVTQMGLTPIAGGPDALARRIKSDSERMGAMVRAIGIEPE
ncbi:Bug family tripartite tricarboxylate transporter substrate binding protein [Ramlibacter sp.]|uniref:Bug family tripartite tricarboxylate transporter substrate binding protein n=1 Tax=Ramlibacter sp. TaxID=1917967 RepID=UPI003D0A8A0B